MLLKIIVIRAVTTQTFYWTTEAWDENSLEENPEGFSGALQKARDQHGGENVRVLTVALPTGALAQPFERPHVVGRPLAPRAGDT